MAKAFQKHCLNCKRYSTHRHTPAEKGKPCTYAGCKCKYFWGWIDAQKRFNFVFRDNWKEIKERRAQEAEELRRVMNTPVDTAKEFIDPELPTINI